MANVSSSNGLEKCPKLRFPGFDEPWKATKFGNLVHEFSDRTKEENEDLLLSAAIEGMFLNTELFGHRRGASNKGYKKIKYGTMVLSTQNLHLGNANVNQRFEHGMVSPAYKTYDITGCSVELIAQWIKSEAAKRFFYNATTVGASVCRRNVEWDTLYEQPLYLPGIDEQDKIAKFLFLISERINKQQQFIVSLKKYKRGVNKQLLSQTDNSCNCRLGSVCEIVGGGTPDTLHTEYWGSTVEWFTPSEIGKTKYVSSSVRKLSEIGLNNSSAKLLPIGTVLLTTRATLGEMSIAKRECCTNQGFQSLIPHQDRVLSEYLYYMQIVIKPWCEKYASGNTFREISKSALSNCIIPLPDRARQEEIVKLLSSIDILISAEEGIAMSLSKMRHSLMQQLFI